MKRALHYNCSILSLIVAVVAGLWLAAPRDICITKMMVAGGCVCLAEAGVENGCVCCAEGSLGQKIACDTHDGSSGQSDNKDEAPISHAPGCFSISSELSHMTGPERSPDTAPAFDVVVAVLPLPLDEIVDRRWDVLPDVRNAAAYDNSLCYRDNCVFLI